MGDEPIEDLVAGRMEEMIGAGKQHQLSGLGNHPHHLRCLRGQDAVVAPVEEQEGAVAETIRRLTAGRLGGEGDHTGHHRPVEVGRGLDGDGPTEGVAECHEPRGTMTTGELQGGDRVVDAGAEVVRSAIAHPHQAHAVVGEPATEPLVETTIGSEQATHGPTDGDNDMARIGRTVPEDREQPRTGVELQVVEPVVDGHCLHREHAEGVERCRHTLGLAPIVGHRSGLAPPAYRVDVRVLVVHAHPDPESYGAAVRDATVRGLEQGGHEVDLVDLAAIGYAPRLTAEEHRNYDTIADDHPDPTVRSHIELVRACQAIVVVYPTFWSGMPAVLKGWLERTMLPGVSFRLHSTTRKVVGALDHVDHLVGVTTYGSPRGYRLLVGDGGRRTLWTLRLSCGRRCRFRWLALDAIDTRPERDRIQFLDRVEARMAELGSGRSFRPVGRRR